MGSRRLTAGLLTAALAAALGGSLGDAHAASQVKVAAKLAKRVTNAKSNGDREKALLAVMRKLNLGVYKGSGATVVPGATQAGKGHPHLYKAEIEMLAGSLGRDDRYDLSDLSRDVEDFRIKPKGGGTLSDEEMRTAIRGAARKALKKSKSGTSLGMLLIHQLGKRQDRSYDLAKLGDGAEPRFDALQRTLILTDLALGVTGNARSSSSTAGAASATGSSPASARAAAKTCGTTTGKKRIAKIAGLIFDEIPVVSDVLKIVPGVYHSKIALGLDFRTVGFPVTVTDTHYGPAGHNEEDPAVTRGGEGLKFIVEVRMLDDVSDDEIKCGALAGLKFPKKGPVKDIEIDWDPLVTDYERLKRHGRIIREDQQTGSDGRASLFFQPHDEVLVGIGKVEIEEGFLEPEALLLSSLGNSGAVVELISGRRLAIRWHISFHPQRAWVELDSTLNLPPDAFGLGCAGAPGCSTAGQIALRVISLVPVELDPATGEVTGQAPLNNVQMSGQVTQTATCGQPPEPYTQTMTPVSVTNGELLAGVAGEEFLLGPGTPLTVGLDPNGAPPEEIYQHQLSGCGVNQTNNINLYAWGQWFYQAHQDEAGNVGSVGTLRLSDLSSNGDDVFVRRYQRPVTVGPPGYSFTATEDTTLTVKPR